MGKDPISLRSSLKCRCSLFTCFQRLKFLLHVLGARKLHFACEFKHLDRHVTCVIGLFNSRIGVGVVFASQIRYFWVKHLIFKVKLTQMAIFRSASLLAFRAEGEVCLSNSRPWICALGCCFSLEALKRAAKDTNKKCEPENCF